MPPLRMNTWTVPFTTRQGAERALGAYRGKGEVKIEGNNLIITEYVGAPTTKRNHRRAKG